MSENKTNMEELLQSGIDLGDTEAVGAADDPFANIGANDDPFANVNSAEDTFVDIEDNNNPFADAVTEENAEVAEEIPSKITGTEEVAETGMSEEAPVEKTTAKEPETVEIMEIKQEEKAVDNNASVQDKQEVSDTDGEQRGSNPFEAEINRVETQAAEETKTGLLNKPPVFKFAGVREDITDLSQTFDSIRAAKATDFPELEDARQQGYVLSNEMTNADAAITRQSIAKFISRVLKLTDTSNESISDRISDWDMTCSKCKESIIKCYANRIMNGYEDGTFRGRYPVTRAEAAVILIKAYNYIGVNGK